MPVNNTNPIMSLLGIAYPIIQGGMAWVAEANLAAAVSNAGGLGLIGAGAMPPDLLREQIRRCRSMTDKPFGVNIMLMSPYVDELARLVIEEDVKVVTTGAGSPGKYIDSWKAHGMKVIPVVASTAYAKRMEKLGVDALVCEGMEAGGHIGELTTMVLIPQIADAVNLPIIAAGGIADGRGIAAAFMLGASAVQVGTRFIVADESMAHDHFKDKIIKAGDIGTIVTGIHGHPVRSLKSPLTRTIAKIEREGAAASAEQLEALAAQSLRKAVVDGNEKEGSFMSGQSAGLVTKRQPVKAIIEEMFREADERFNSPMDWRHPVSFRKKEDNT